MTRFYLGNNIFLRGDASGNLFVENATTGEVRPVVTGGLGAPVTNCGPPAVPVWNEDEDLDMAPPVSNWAAIAAWQREQERGYRRGEREPVVNVPPAAAPVSNQPLAFEDEDLDMAPPTVNGAEEARRLRQQGR